MENAMTFLPVQENKINDVVSFWNANFSTAFHVNESMICRKVLEDKDLFLPGTFLCMEGNNIVGLIVTKVSDNSLPEYQNTAWLSSLAVKKSRRRTGIGGSMYRTAEAELRKAGIRKLIVAGEMDNFFSGIPDPSPENRSFFEKFGFTLNTGEHYDLANDVSKMDFDSLPVTIRRRPEFVTRVLAEERIPALEAFLEKEFPGRWVSEVKTFLKNGGNRAHLVVLCRDEEVKGFCKIHVSGVGGNFAEQLGDHWGSLGPIGVAEDIRGLGQGNVLLCDSLRHLKTLGARSVFIDWTILKDFYGQFGFTPWRTYLGAYKVLQD